MKNRPYPYYNMPDLHTLCELIDNGEKAGGDITVFYTGPDERPLSFRECAAGIRSIGAFLSAQGFHGKNIALLGENSTEWCLCYFGITNSGNVVVPLDRNLPEDELYELLAGCDCSALFYSEKLKEKVSYCQDRDASLSDIRLFSIQQLDAILDEGSQRLLSGQPVSETEITPDTLACIVYTSGTSGKCKGVMLTHGNLTTDVVATCRCVTARHAQVFLPLNHAFSWASAMFAAFLYIKDGHISENLHHVIRDMERNKPQNISAVPMMVEMIYNGIWNTARKQGKEKKLKRGIRLSRALMAIGIDVRRRLFRSIHATFGGQLETIICGGAALDEKIQRGLYDIGIQVITGYGITECSPVVSVNRNHDYRFGSVGRPLPCNRVIIHDPDANGIGEIYVSGSNVMKGYYKDPEATAEAFDGEWFKTGDQGRMDKDGFLYITGRKKNLIILSNGENVSPEELEQKLCRFEYVKEVAVYEENRNITAEFYLDEASYPDAKERLSADVKQFNRKMPSAKNIHHIKVRPVPFEKNTTMKIKRHLLNDGEKNR